MPTILIGADLCPIEGNTPYFKAGDAGSLFNDLLPEFRQADLVIANLECPLISEPSPIPKTGPTFGEARECVNGIQAAGINVLCLANNHIKDHGESGIRSTLAACADAGIETVGAGENLEKAGKMLVKTVNGVEVGILAVAENEFSLAGREAWGANPLDLIQFVRTVQKHKDLVKHLIVLYHGSAEFHVPTPRLRETCRFMIEMGAGTVIVQHPHVLGGYEKYLGGNIVYGQGALVMDEAVYRDLKTFHEGVLVKLDIAKDGTSTMDLIPFTQSDPVPGARRMAPEREETFLACLAERAQAVTDDTFVEREWLDYCRRKKSSYLSGLLGHNRVLRKLNERGLLQKLLYNTRVMLGVRNIVCCETHREAIETIFNDPRLK